MEKSKHLLPGRSAFPHYVYHGALAQVQDLNVYFIVYDVAPEVREEVARSILYLWKKSQNDMLVDKYILHLMQIPLGSITQDDALSLRRKVEEKW